MRQRPHGPSLLVWYQQLGPHHSSLLIRLDLVQALLPQCKVQLESMGSESWTSNQTSQPDLGYGREEQHRTISKDLLEPGLKIKRSLESGYSLKRCKCSDKKEQQHGVRVVIMA
ncbi:unnamed protein product [Caretta caretta]